MADVTADRELAAKQADSEKAFEIIKTAGDRWVNKGGDTEETLPSGFVFCLQHCIAAALASARAEGPQWRPLLPRLIQAAESCRTLAITFNCPSTEKAMDELLAECKPEAPHVQ